MQESAPHARDHDLVTIQCLRGIAAVMVVIYHCYPQMERMGYQGLRLTWLTAGVDIFFIISGFIMLYSASRRPDRGGGEFLADRAIRILPLYWMLTAVVATIAIALPQLLQSSRFDLGHAASSFAMMAWPHPVNHQWEPLLTVGWTLNYESFFYAIFAVALWLGRGDLSKLCAIACSAILLCHLAAPISEYWRVADFYTDGVILEFAYGMLACRAILSGWHMSTRASIALDVAGTLALCASPLFSTGIREYTLGLPALAIFMGALFLPIDRNTRGIGLLRRVGDASYSLYLSHFMLMSALGQAWQRSRFWKVPGWEGAFVLSSVTICVIAGMMLHKWVERPMTHWLKSRLSRSRKLPATGN